MKTTSIILLSVLAVMAVEPNFVRSTVFQVGKDGSGNPTNLVSTSYSDGLGRQTESKIKIDATHDRTACTFYDEAGRPEFSTKAFVDNLYAGSYLSKTLIELNDAANGLLRKQVGYNNDANPYSYTKYSDDPLSRVIEQNGPGADFAGNPVKTWYFGVKKDNYTISPSGININFADGIIHNPIDNPINTALLTALSEYVPTFVVDHYLTVTQDPRSTDAHPIYTQELKDLFGKTVATFAQPSSSSLIVVYARYSYDILGNLTSEVAPKPSDPLARIDNTDYTYNTLGQLINKVTPDGGMFDYTYTPTGQIESVNSYTLVSTVKTSNRYLSYEYDDFDRLLRIRQTFSGSGSVEVILNFYDNVEGFRQAAKSNNISDGELSELENTNGRLVASIVRNSVNGIRYYVVDLFSYDDEGRLKKKIKVVPGLPHQNITYTYDLHGKVMTETTECGSELVVKEYQYDAEGRLENVVHANNANKVLAHYSYDPLSRLESKALAIGTGHEIDYLYNIREWVYSISSPTSVKKFDEWISDYAPNGNINAAVYGYSTGSSQTPYNLTYAYDDVNRLTGVTDNSAQGFGANYSYDVIGRINTKEEGAVTKPGYRYYSGTSRLMNTENSTTIKKYFYDKHGNMVIDVAKKMVIEYDWRDMPVAFRFYDALPAALPCDTRGTFNGTPADPGAYVVAANKTLLSQVVMLYDASGNRVMKMEGK